MLTLTVEGVPAPGLAAFQVELRFDPRRLEVRDPNAEFVEFGIRAFAPLGSSPVCSVVRGTSPCPDAAWMVTETGRQAVGTASIDNETGRVSIAYGTAGDQRLPSGNGTLAIVEVFAKRGGPVSLEIVDALLADASDPPRKYPW